jgi:TPR repeat protein
MTGPQGRALSIITVIVVLGAVLWFAMGTRGKESPPVASNQISPEKLSELKQKAEAGDAAAQYALTLYVDDVSQAEQFLKKATDAGHPPAVVTFAETLMNKGGAEAGRARSMLEGVAQRGYYPAIAELVRCLDAGECGQPSKVDAYTWVAVADLLAQHGKIEKSELGEEGKRLRPQLTQVELERAQANAKTIAERVSAAGSR